jgi:hypothetical protein
MKIPVKLSVLSCLVHSCSSCSFDRAEDSNRIEGRVDRTTWTLTGGAQRRTGRPRHCEHTDQRWASGGSSSKGAACLTYRLQLALSVHQFIDVELSRFSPSQILGAFYFLISYVWTSGPGHLKSGHLLVIHIASVFLAPVLRVSSLTYHILCQQVQKCRVRLEGKGAVKRRGDLLF